MIFFSAILPLAILLVQTSLINAQYGGDNYASNYGGGQYAIHSQSSSNYSPYSSAYQSDQSDDRPKLNLGFRLRIPAFKFELPRLSLPKITVSAKIRNPEGPRIITLPEINFDTSSNSAQGSNFASHSSSYRKSLGDYRDSNQPYKSNYGSQSSSHSDSGSFTFTSEEDNSPEDYSRPTAGYTTNSYRPANFHPSYMMATQPRPVYQQQNHYQRKKNGFRLR